MQSHIVILMINVILSEFEITLIEKKKNVNPENISKWLFFIFIIVAFERNQFYAKIFFDKFRQNH